MAGRSDRIRQQVAESAARGDGQDDIWGALLVAGYSAQEIADALTSLGGTQGSRPRDTPTLQAVFNRLERDRDLFEVGAGAGEASDNALQRLASRPIAPVSRSQRYVEAMVVCLSDAGLTVTEPLVLDTDHVALPKTSGDNSSIVLCLDAQIMGPLSIQVNRLAHKTGQTVLYHSQRDLSVIIGPLVYPWRTACYECYRTRRYGVLTPWERSLFDVAAAVGSPGSIPLGVDWLVAELAKVITGIGVPISTNRILSIDYFSSLPEVHEIIRVPRCSVCGPELPQSRRIWKDEDLGYYEPEQ